MMITIVPPLPSSSMSKSRGVSFFCYFLVVFLLCVKDNTCQSKSLPIGKSPKGAVATSRNENAGAGAVAGQSSGSSFIKKQSRSSGKSRKMKDKEVKDKNKKPVSNPVPPPATLPPSPSTPSSSTPLYTTIQLRPMELILTSTLDQFEIKSPQVLEVLRVTKNHFKNNFKNYASFDVSSSLFDASFQMEKPQNVDGNTEHRFLLRGFNPPSLAEKELFRGEGVLVQEGKKEMLSISSEWGQTIPRHLSESNRVTTKITGIVTFEKDHVPDRKNLEEVQEQIFTTDYTNSIEKVFEGSSVTAEISFDTDGSSTTDKGSNNGSGGPGTGTGAGKENVAVNNINAGNGSGKAGGIAAGVIIALVVIAIGVAFFIKNKNKDNQHQNSQQRQKRHLPFTTPWENRNKNDVDDSYYDENQRYSVVYEMKNDRDNGVIYEATNNSNINNNNHRYGDNNSNQEIEKISSSNVIISNNDDGSVIEAVYASPVRLCSALKRFCSASPRRIKNQSRSPRGRISDAVADDTYSLDGSYAIDNQKPTSGDNMLSHVLSMNSYNCELELVSPDTAATTPSNEDSYKYHVEEVQEDEEEYSVQAGDLSTYSYSNEYSADCQSVISSRTSPSVSGMSAMQKLGNMNPFNKRRTISDLRRGSVNNSTNNNPQSSPLRTKDCIIYENSPSNPGINVVTSHQRELMGANETESVAYSENSEVKLEDNLSSDGSSSGILLNIQEEEEEILPTSNENRSQSVLRNTGAPPEREEIPNSYQCEYDSCQILPTEITDISNPNICRASSIIPGRRRQHKITVTTTAPPPPRTPERFPLQSANPNNIGGIDKDSAFSSDSESSDDDINNFDFSQHGHSNRPTQKNSGKDLQQLTEKRKKKDFEGTNTRQRACELNPFVEIHDTDRNYRRNFTNNSANARNARRNRLGKSIEREKVVDNTSRAEIVSIMRRSRVQRQQMARSQVNRRD